MDNHAKTAVSLLNAGNSDNCPTGVQVFELSAKNGRFEGLIAVSAPYIGGKETRLFPMRLESQPRNDPKPERQ